MGLRAKIEAIIYAAEEPVTLEQLAALMSEAVLGEETAGRARAGGDTEPPITGEATTTDEAPPPGELASGPSSPEAETRPAEDAPAQGDVAAPGPDEAQQQAEAGATSANAQAEAASQAHVEAPESAADAEADVAAGPVGQAARRGKSGKEAAKKDPAVQARVKSRVRALVEELIAEYARDERGIEIRQVAGGFRMATKLEHHDVVRAFARSLKPPLRLSIPALETLAVIAYKQPVTVPEISEIRGVEAAGVIGTLLDRKLITTAGRKQVIGRPILYKTSKEFLLRFGLKDLGELPSMEEFERLAMDGQVELFTPAAATATAQPGTPEGAAPASAEAAATQTGQSEVPESHARSEEPASQTSSSDDTVGDS